MKRKQSVGYHTGMSTTANLSVLILRISVHLGIFLKIWKNKEKLSLGMGIGKRHAILPTRELLEK
jgi:hypothetical protein